MEYLIALLGVLTIHAAEPKARVAVLDTGLSQQLMKAPWLCKDGHIDLTGTGINDTHGHGTNIAAIIGPALNPKTQCLVMIKWTTGKTVKGLIPLVEVYKYLFEPNILWINYSAEGKGHMDEERKLIMQLVAKGKHVAVAAGNKSLNLSAECAVYPACYNIPNTPLWHVVANGKSLAELSFSSNYGGPVNAVEDGQNVMAGGVMFSGTSQATAKYTARLIREYNATR